MNVAARGTPSAACAPVVTRILYVVPEFRGAAGLAVNVAFPALGVGAPAILMHFTKSLLESCRVPLQTVFFELTVIEEGLAARLNVTLIVVPTGTPVAPSAGAADETENAFGVGVIVGVLVGVLVGVRVGVWVGVPGVGVGVGVGAEPVHNLKLPMRVRQLKLVVVE